MINIGLVTSNGIYSKTTDLEVSRLLEISGRVFYKNRLKGYIARGCYVGATRFKKLLKEHKLGIENSSEVTRINAVYKVPYYIIEREEYISKQCRYDSLGEIGGIRLKKNVDVIEFIESGLSNLNINNICIDKEEENKSKLVSEVQAGISLTRVSGLEGEIKFLVFDRYGKPIGVSFAEEPSDKIEYGAPVVRYIGNLSEFNDFARINNLPSYCLVKPKNIRQGYSEGVGCGKLYHVSYTLEGFRLNSETTEYALSENTVGEDIKVYFFEVKEVISKE